MYWKPTPVRGVEEAELPQFTIIGYETNDRKVYAKIREFCAIILTFCCFFLGKISYRNLSKIIVVI